MERFSQTRNKSPENQVSSEFSKWGREILEALDFDELRNIFAERLKKSGLEVDDSTLIQLRDVEPLPNYSYLMGISGLHRTERGKSKIFVPDPTPDSIESATDWLSQVLKNINARIFSSLVHEMTHSASSNEKVEEGEEVWISNSGISRNETINPTAPKERETIAVGNLLNEAITERIAKEVHDEYVRRMGVGDQKDIFGRKDFNFHEAKGYRGRGKQMYESLAHLVSQEYDVPEDIVHRAFEHAYYTGLNFAEPDFENLVEEVLSSDGYDAISQSYRQNDPHTKLALRLIRERLEMNNARIEDQP